MVEDQLLALLVREAYERSRRTYGSPRVHVELAETHGVFVSRKRVIRIMQREGLRARPRKRFKCCTVSDHDQPVAANVLDRRFTANRPNQRWVGDTTEFVTGNGKRFLAVILDLFSRYVVGWARSPSNDRFLTLKALDMAIKRRCPDEGLIHHSDQGSTCASEGYRKVLTAHGITCSMSRRGNVFDNAAMGSWNSTFKAECGERFETNVVAEEEVFGYMEGFYNPARRHSAIGYISPAEFERTARGRLVA